MDISNLRERPSDAAMSVSELNGFIKNMFDSNRLLSAVTVRGEISNFVYHRSGHLYFSLKDSEGQIKAVMFKSSALKLKFVPENGMKVIVHGSVSVYTAGGSYQLYAYSMQPDGIGALYLAYEQLKEKLSLEGLFSPEHKMSIPQYPRAVGVVTSPTGAAVRDIINVIGRRYPLAKIYVYGALVQGEGAEQDLIAGIDYFDKSGLVDTVIIGRGGGSIEDLWAFNSEALARRIYDACVPIISAVGHETDFTICDFVSDMRAPTPSAAAELAVPDIRELMLRIDSLRDLCDRSLNNTVSRAYERLEGLKSREVIKKPEAAFARLKDKVSMLEQSLNNDIIKTISACRSDFAVLVGKTNALNPLSVLSRGYSVTEKDGRAVKDACDLRVGDEIKIRLCNGAVTAEVTEV